MSDSSAYVTCTVGGNTYTYYFTGVTEIEHNLALNLDNTESQGLDIVNGARNLPNQVTLSVVETDVEHTPGWSARMLEAMATLKKNRVLCRVVTLKLPPLRKGAWRIEKYEKGPLVTFFIHYVVQ